MMRRRRRLGGSRRERDLVGRLKFGIAFDLKSNMAGSSWRFLGEGEHSSLTAGKKLAEDVLSFVVVRSRKSISVKYMLCIKYVEILPDFNTLLERPLAIFVTSCTH